MYKQYTILRLIEVPPCCHDRLSALPQICGSAKAARTPNAISLDASEKERLLELRYTLILLSNI